LKSLIFDSGPIISLTTNNLVWLLEELKRGYGGDFFIVEAVKRELIDRPLATKKFKFEALQVLKYINGGILKIIESSKLKEETIKLLDLANNSFNAKGNWLRIVHYAEMSGLAACNKLNSDAFVVDERTTRLLVENPNRLVEILESTLHTDIKINDDNLEEFEKRTKNIKLIRSVELVTVAYEQGWLNKYLPNIPNAKKILLDSVLWGVKLNGCAVSKREIDQIIKLEK